MKDRTTGRSRLSWAGFGGLFVSILALAVALLVTVDEASLHFRRGALAQAQFAAVLRIERLAGTDSADRARIDAVAAYRRLIDEETALLPVSARQGQRREADDGASLAALVRGGGDPDARRRVGTIVAGVIARERGEAVEEARAMAALRHRTLWLASLLAATALGCAGLGALGLLATNRRLADEVARRTADIAAIDASRRLFFAKASHELRTPVTVMRGEAEVALAQPGGERDALRHVVAQAEFLDHRIGELLGLAQAEDGKLRLDHGAIDLTAIVRGAVAAVSGFARSNDVVVTLEAAPETPMAGDARWLEQAIVAVLDNAVKFSPAGDSVSVVLSRGDDRATLTITDRGAGVVAPSLPLVFDAYYQTDAGRMRGGSGLGLALARWVVERHGGTIDAANEAAGGTTITMTVPIAR